MKIQLVTKPLSEVKSEYIVLPIFEGEKPVFNGVVADFLSDNPKFGKLFETQLIYSKDKKILVIGLGKKEKLNFASLQNWVGCAVKYLSKKTKQASLILPDIDSLTAAEVGQALEIGSESAIYDPAEAYKSDYEKAKLNELEVLVSRAEKGYQEGLKSGQIIAEAINFARKLEDMPANEMTPTYFLNQTKRVAKENRLKLTILDEKQASKKGMGAFVGVAKGSDEPSYMIALEYKGDARTKEKWGLVGKGITFDSGGISIKPGESMHEMRYDMCGAANVLATLKAVAKLGLKTNVVGVMAITENLPGGKAQRPGDIVKSYSGKTVEIINTDAEGRLVLIDAVAYALKDFRATKLVDLATLTGAIQIALGDFITGAFGNNPKFTQELISIGTRVGEKFWEMPMDEEFSELIKSDFADIINTSTKSRTASSTVGAKFIEAGVDDKPWVHLDIAGTAWDLKPKPFRNPGATGVGIKTLVKLISG